MELPLLSLYSLRRSERIYQLFLDRNLKVLQTQIEYSIRKLKQPMRL